NKLQVLENVHRGFPPRSRLWDLVAGEETIPANTPANADLRRKWKVKCGKALFALRTSISKEFIDHVRDITSPKEVWETLERLFSKKYTARLQFLEKLAVSTQGGMSISEYFLKLHSTILSDVSNLTTSVALWWAYVIL
nr:UBN2_3 domain-containing protein [Tanacetum cinerariifolium]